MIELLILHELNKNVLTMYGISKSIKNEFSAFLLPSYGTISPALKRLKDTNYITAQKVMSTGGRPSTYYSITKTGKQALCDYILQTLPDNPVQFLTIARIRLFCINVLNDEEKFKLFNMLKIKAESILIDTKRLYDINDNNFYQKMVYDNLGCEYKNLISLIEGFQHASNH